MKATVLYSGGKDSTYALHKAVEAGHQVAVLSTIIPLYKYSMLYHKPSFNVVQAQAYSLNIPLESIGVYNEKLELDALRNLLRRVRDKYGVKILVTGAIASNYQRTRFKAIADELGLELYTPLWGRDPRSYLEELLDYGVRFLVTSITSMGIPLDILGREITMSDVERLVKLSEKYGFNPSFEGGDAETIVVDSPLFRYKLVITGEKSIVSEFEGYFEPLRIKLVEKNLLL